VRLFLLSFFLIYGGMHAYVFLKARAAFPFGPKAGVPLALWMALMVLAPIIVRVSENRGQELFARQAALVGYVWLGLLFLFISASLLIDAYRLFMHLGGWVLKKEATLLPSARTAFFVCILVAVAAFAYGYFEANDIRTERITLKSPRLSGTLKVVQISDVHLGLIIREKRLKRILDIVRAEEPDVLVSTGDLVDGQINSLPGLAEMLREIRPRYGKYAITGNHEYYAGLGQALEFIEKAGFRILRNEGLTVEGLINIAGVDDPTGGQLGIESPVRSPEAEVLSALPRDTFTLLLKHRPRVDVASLGLFDLQLSGHTHRGQIFPFRFVVQVPYPRIEGLYGLSEDSELYVSRGSGTWGPPIRVFAPPEVTVIELVGEAAR
jgi:predicted MPP superfamily phosphohydrolase